MVSTTSETHAMEGNKININCNSNNNDGSNHRKNNGEKKSGFSFLSWTLIIVIVIIVILLIIYFAGFSSKLFLTPNVNELYRSGYLENNFTLKRILGEGAFGIVTAVAYNRNGELFAIKETAYSESDPNRHNEIKILAACRHQNITRIYDAWIDKGSNWFPHRIPNNIPRLYIQMELCSETLSNWLTTSSAIQRHPFVNNIFLQIVSAVQHIHGNGIIHRDLKPGNILFGMNRQVKVADFGLAVKTSQPVSGIAGTKDYMAPEVLNGESYDYKVDIYSLGIIFFELLVDFATIEHRQFELKRLRYEIFPIFNPSISKLLQKMLSSTPSERITATELRHLLLPALAS